MDKSNLTQKEIAEQVSKRHGLCAWHLLNGKREKNNTNPVQAGLVIIDIDNQADHKDQGDSSGNRRRRGFIQPS